MENEYSADPRLDYIAHRGMGATRIMVMAAMLILAVHIPAKLVGLY